MGHYERGLGSLKSVNSLENDPILLCFHSLGDLWNLLNLQNL